MKINYLKEIKSAITIRLVENELLDLFTQGELNGTVHTAVGQEFSGVFISKYLNENDFVVTNHRGHGHYLSRTNNIKGLVGEIMGKLEGVSGGYGGSQHLVDKNFLSNGIQGGMVPIASGHALYYKLNNLNNIAVSYIGDGTLGEGIIYETFNIASMLELPLLIVLENNGYAQSTPFKQTFRGDIQKRIEGFGLKYFRSSTYDLSDLDLSTKSAIDFVRATKKPALIEIETYRLNSHSKGDDNRYNSEIIEKEEKDLLSKIFNSNDKDINEFILNTKSEIKQIILELKKTKNLEKSFYKHTLSNLKTLPDISPEIKNHGRYNSLIYESFVHIFNHFPNTIMLGEDIQNKTNFTEKNYGGAFKVTKDLSDLFKNRIFNTPISESAIVGITAGYSMIAGRSIVEIMFGDFTTLILDQIIQHSSKFERMYNGKISCPLVVRTPMGGKRGYGPTHSQSLEKHFLGIDNFAVVALNHRISPKYVYSAIFSLQTMPFLVIENKILYTIDTSKANLLGYEYEFNNDLFPILKITPKNNNAQLTVFCYGEVLNDLEDAALDLLLEEDIFIEIICPTLISDVNIEFIKTSVANTRKVIIIEEGSGYSSWGSEIVSSLVESGISQFDLKRLSNKFIIPSSYLAEVNQLPNVESIKNILKSII